MPRHNYSRYGRLLMAVGRDAADVAITTSFGAAYLEYFYVESNEIDAAGEKIPLPIFGPDGTFVSPNPANLNTPTQTNASHASPIQTQSATL